MGWGKDWIFGVSEYLRGQGFEGLAGVGGGGGVDVVVGVGDGVAGEVFRAGDAGEHGAGDPIRDLDFLIR